MFPPCCMSSLLSQQRPRALALLFGAIYILCFFWGNLLTDPAINKLHMDLLRVSFPFAFSGMDLMSFISGLIQSVFWGFVFGLGWDYFLKVSAKK